MIERYETFFRHLEAAGLASLSGPLRETVAAALAPERHGDLTAWREVLAGLPALTPMHLDLDADCLGIGDSDQLEEAARTALRERLMALHPWRKGPFCLFGLHLDTEWRSDWKWQRIAPVLDLDGKRVLDVGCGNGYYGWRMRALGADLVLGIDPTLRYVMQYLALQHFIQDGGSVVLPLSLEQLPPAPAAFDTVLSMGVLYHRRDPLDHLRRLRACLQPGGELVLETLVIEGDTGEVLAPAGRYAKMKNVWAIPSVPMLEAWLKEAGYRAIRCVDVTPTTTGEQRRTPWMQFESLADYLDRDDPSRTVEGHPAPIRAVVTATR